MQDNWGLIQAEYKWFYGPQMFQGVGEFGILEVRTVSGILSRFEEEISQWLMIWGQWLSSKEAKMTNHAFWDLI